MNARERSTVLRMSAGKSILNTRISRRLEACPDGSSLVLDVRFVGWMDKCTELTSPDVGERMRSGQIQSSTSNQTRATACRDWSLMPLADLALMRTT